MPMNAFLLPEYDHEMATTRRVLSRLEDDKLDFKPHERSWPMRSLATHIARIPGWTAITINSDELDLAAPDTSGPPPQSTAEIVEVFDKMSSDGRALLTEVSDEALLQPWSLKSGEKVLMTMPRLVVLRGFVMNHLIHHRGQLSVYLRLNDIPVPSIYGPSADDSGGF